MSWVLAAIAAAPLAGGAASWLGQRSGREGCWGRLPVLTTGAALLAALALLATLGAEQTLRLSVGGDALVLLRVDRVGALLATITLAVAWVVFAYADRYLQGDLRAGRLALLSGALVTAAVGVALAGTLLGFALMWTVCSWMVWSLVGLYRGYGPADDGARRTRKALLTGDAALWLAVAVLTARHGQIELPIGAGLEGGLTAAGLGVLLLIAAAARSVQVPFHTWLPATLASPTPVSALLHAGVVNAGAVVLLAGAPLLAAAPAVLYLTFAVGAITVLFGTAMTLVRPDVKGQLAQSTVAQMGFMIMTCGLGAFAAALIHLAGHSLFKAALFLGSGGAVERVQAHAPQPPQRDRLASGLIASIVAGAAVLGAVWWLQPPATGTALLVFAWATLARSGAGWLSGRRGVGPVTGLAASAAVLAPAYVVAVEALTHFLEPAAPLLAGAPSPWLLAPVVAALALLTWAQATPAGRWQRRLYVWALTAGDGSRPERARRGTPIPTTTLNPEGSWS